MLSLWYELRQAIRRLSRAPGFACMAILTLGVGIGSVAAIYSALDAVLLRPLPFRDAERLVVIDGAYAPPLPGPPKIALDLLDWRAMKGTFDGVASYKLGTLNLATSTGANRVSASQITPDLFPLLGVQPNRGRNFTAEEGTVGPAQVAILSAGFWRRQFGSATDILGQVITLESLPYVVVGVMPDGFSFPGRPDIWIPDPLLSPDLPLVDGEMITVARLRDGVSQAEAQRRVTAAERMFSATHEQPAWINHAKILPFRSVLEGNAWSKLRLLAGVAGLLLLLACANVAGLLLARAETRQHDIALRAALGASPSQLVRPLIADGCVLAILGAGVGVLLAWVLSPLLATMIPKGMLGIASLGVNESVLVGSLGAGVVSVLIFCLAPALTIRRTDVNTILKSSGSRSATRTGRLWSQVLAGQIALTVVILVASGLLLKSLWLLEQVDPGFERTGALSVDVTLPRGTYATRPQRSAYIRKAMARIKELPGVSEAGVVSALPLSGHTFGLTFDVAGRPVQSNVANPPIAQFFDASSGYFSALRIPVLAGRTFTEADAANGASVMVIDEKLARRLGPIEEAVGEQIKMSWDSTYRIIGVVRTVRGRSLDGSREWVGAFYLPTYLDPPRSMTFVVRGPVRSRQFVEAVRRAVASVDPTVPAYSVRTVDDVVDDSLDPLRTVTFLLTVGAAFGVLLAVVGVFGITAASVARRTREIGIRIALGASGARIGGLVLRQALSVALAGAIFGLMGAWVASRLLAHLLYGVRSVDPGVYVSVSLVVSLAAIVAAAVPVWRASIVDPIMTLRGD